MQRRIGGLAAGTALVLTLLAAAGCGGSSAKPQAPAPPAATAPAAAKASGKLTPVTLRFDWLVGGQHIGFIAAQAQGYYKKAGLDVHMDQGKGSSLTLQTVASGASTFGLAAADVAAIGISKGMPVKVIGVVLQNTPSCIFYHGSDPVTTAQSLRGRVVISSAGNANLQILPAVLDRYGMTLKDIRLELVQPSAFVGTLMNNPKAVELGYIMNELPPFQHLDPRINCKLYSAFGVNAYNVGIVTTDKLIQNHPGLVRRFMAASTEGWQWAMAHPKQAVADAAKLFPNGASAGNAAVLARSFQIAIPLLHTPATKGHPLFWMAASDWKDTVSVAHKYEGLKNPKPLGDYYTNAFIAQ